LDVVIACTDHILQILPVWFFNKFRGIKMFREYNEYPSRILGKKKKLPVLNDFFHRSLFNLFDGFIVISTALEDYFIEMLRGKKSIFKMPIIVDNSRFGIGKKDEIQIDKIALSELLLTGGIIAPDTLVSGIKKLIQSSLNTEVGKIIQLKALSEEDHDGETELFQEIKSSLSSYFSSFKDLFSSFGLSTGLSGGFDSRMLVAFLDKLSIKSSYFHFRNSGASKSIQIVKKIADFINANLKFVNVSKKDESTGEEEFNQRLENGFLFCDGNIRSQLYYHELQNSAETIRNLHGQKVNLAGIGGEQYRNSERYRKKDYNYKEWLKYDVAYKYSVPCFDSSNDEKKVLDNIALKIAKRIGKSEKEYKRINFHKVKLYLNEVYLEAVRSYRVSFENQLHHSLAPFADGVNVHNARQIIDELGDFSEFQQKLLVDVNEELAALPGSYSFTFNKKVPIHLSLINKLKDLIPKKLFYLTYTRIKKFNNDDLYFTMENKYPVTFLLHNSLIDELGLNMDVNKLKRNKYSGRLLISIAYWLRKINEINHTKNAS